MIETKPVGTYLSLTNKIFLQYTLLHTHYGDLLSKASIPGSTLPSNKSNEAPPPDET